MSSLLPNFSTRINQLDGQISRIWRLLQEKVSNVISTNSDGSITIGTFENPISRIILNSDFFFGALSSDALSFRNRESRAVRVFSQNGSGTTLPDAYMGLVSDTDTSVMRDKVGNAVSIITEDGLYAANGIGWDTAVYSDFEDFMTEVFPEISYNLPPPSDLMNAI